VAKRKKAQGPLHIVTYDIEIAVHADKYPKRELGEVSWEEAKQGKAGVSAVAVWDNLTGRPHLYDAHNILECIEHLNEADLNVGWNSNEFDKPALEGFTNKKIHADQLDIREYVIAAIGDKYATGYRLGQTCERTIGFSKNGSGIGAPRLAQDGRFAELFDYNINDVWLTRLLHNHIVQQGWIVSPKLKRIVIRKYPTKELA
jgi:hypothetical protein